MGPVLAAEGPFLRPPSGLRRGSPGLVWNLETSPDNRAALRMKGAAVISKGRVFTLGRMGGRYGFDEEAADRGMSTFQISK